MPKDTKTLGNSKARACESLGFVHKKGCARVLTQPLIINESYNKLRRCNFSSYCPNKKLYEISIIEVTFL